MNQILLKTLKPMVLKSMMKVMAPQSSMMGSFTMSDIKS